MLLIRNIKNEYHFQSEEFDNINPISEDTLKEMFDMIKEPYTQDRRLKINHSSKDKDSELEADYNITLIINKKE